MRSGLRRFPDGLRFALLPPFIANILFLRGDSATTGTAADRHGVIQPRVGMSYRRRNRSVMRSRQGRRERIDEEEHAYAGTDRDSVADKGGRAAGRGGNSEVRSQRGTSFLSAESSPSLSRTKAPMRPRESTAHCEGVSAWTVRGKSAGVSAQEESERDPPPVLQVTDKTETPDIRPSGPRAGPDRARGCVGGRRLFRAFLPRRPTPSHPARADGPRCSGRHLRSASSPVSGPNVIPAASSSGAPRTRRRGATN